MVTATTSNSTSPIRWALVPLAIGLFVLVGLAISTEDRNQFEARRSEPSSASGQSPNSTSGGEPQNVQPVPGRGGQLAPGQGPSGEVAPDGPVAPSGPVSVSGSQTVSDQPATVEIGSDAGQVGILLGDGQSLAQPRSPGQGGAAPIVLRPDAAGDIAGLRLTEDGQLQPVGIGDIQPGDLVLQPAGDGIDIVRGDGSRVELRPDATGAGYEATEVGIGGQLEPLTPNADGEIDIGDGIVIGASSGGNTEPAAPPSLWEQATSTPWRWIFLGIAALAVASAALGFYLHRKRPDDTFGPDFVGPAGVPAERFAEFVDMLLADDDPARAIRLAFFAAERGLGGLPYRHSIETPFEWCERVVETHPLVAEPLGSLCNRYATARFALEQPSRADRDDAVTELQALARLAGEHQGRGGTTGSRPVGPAGDTPDTQTTAAGVGAGR